MLVERFTAFLHARARFLLALWIVHTFALHWIFIGFTSWDGMTYRVPPAVEFAQHGAFGMEKYNQWAFMGYSPFVELVQIPFLAIFKLPGLIIGFPLVVFPLCVLAVYALIRELTDDPKCGTFGALAYAAVPFVNQQPYSGYIDFAVTALLAAYVYSVLRVRTCTSTAFSLMRITGAAILFTMSRSQGIYVLVMVFPVIAYALFTERSGLRIRITSRRKLMIATLATAAGSIPAIGVQVMKYLRFGTPMYPFQFQLMGIKIGEGVTTDALFTYAGIRDNSFGERLSAFVGGWIWPRAWPLGGFFDSRNMGGGFLLLIALLVAPLFVKRARRAEIALVAACFAVSLLARDYLVPRYAYTLIIAFAVIVGRALGSPLPWSAARPVFWVAVTSLLLHAARPEFDLAMIGKHGVGPRLNVTSSTSFLSGPEAFEPLPDLGRKLVIIDVNANGFVLPLYGARLTNEVIATVPESAIGQNCIGLAPFLEQDGETLFIDDLNHTRDCTRACAIPSHHGACLAYEITPGLGHAL